MVKVTSQGQNPNLALSWHSALAPYQCHHKHAVRCVYTMDVVAEPVQTAMLEHVHHCASQLPQLCASLVLLAQGCAEDLPEAGEGLSGAAPWREEVEMGRGHWTIS